jgi:hypothetical protein
MKLFSLIIVFISTLLLVNVYLKGVFDKLTMYKDWELHNLPAMFVLYYMFFGIFMFPFYKKVRLYRKKIYCESIVKRYYYWYICIPKEQRPQPSRLTEDEYHNCKRYLKLVKLSRKCKRFRLW